MTSFLRVRLSDTAVSLPVTSVREVLRAVAITPVPGAPGIIEGAINVRGELIAVIDVRQRLSLAAKTLDPDEFLVVLQTRGRAIALRVDDVDDLVDVGAEPVAAPGALSPALSGLVGLSARSDGVLVIYDPDVFVSQAESDAIDAAVAASV